MHNKILSIWVEVDICTIASADDFCSLGSPRQYSLIIAPVFVTIDGIFKAGVLYLEWRNAHWGQATLGQLFPCRADKSTFL